MKRTEGSCKDIKEVKSAIASILYIISNSARFNVEEQQLSLELQQIGLPKESSESLCRSYKNYKEKLIQHFKTKTLRCKWLDFIMQLTKY